MYQSKFFTASPESKTKNAACPQSPPDHIQSTQGSSENQTPTRTLKIEEDGDYWKRKVKPKIRLKGYWLERAGFKPGQHASVKCLAPGVIELRSKEA